MTARARHAPTRGAACARSRPGRRPPAASGTRRSDRLLGDDAGVVVVDLVIVPRDDPRKRRVRAPAGRGRSCTARSGSGSRRASASRPRRACARRRCGRPTRRCSRRGGTTSVEVLVGEMAERREVAHLEVLARHERESHRSARRSPPAAFACGRSSWSRRRRRTGTSTGDPAQARTLRRGPNALSRRGVDRAALHDVPHPVVLGDSPADLDPLRRHAAAVQRIRREPRPQHDAVGRRIAGRDTERERGGLEARRAAGELTKPGGRDGQREAALGRRRAKREGGSQERAAREHGEKVQQDRLQFTLLGSQCSVRVQVRFRVQVRSSGFLLVTVVHFG